MIPRALAKLLSERLSPDIIDNLTERLRPRGLWLDQYVEIRMAELKRAPRAHIYLAQLRNERRERERNITIITTPVDEPGTTEEENHDDDTRAAI